MPRETIITTITSEGTVYSVGRSAANILTDLQRQLMPLKEKTMTQKFNDNFIKRGSFLPFSRKLYTNSFQESTALDQQFEAGRSFQYDMAIQRCAPEIIISAALSLIKPSQTGDLLFSSPIKELFRAKAR